METNYLAGWDAKTEQQKADFMEHMYKCSGRTNGLFTGLWEQFCLKAIEEFVRLEKEKASADNAEEFVATFHD